MGKEEGNSVALVLGRSSLIDDVRAHLKGYRIIVIEGSEADTLRSKICRILFQWEEVSLPIVILVDGHSLRGVIIGLPSDALWKRVVEYMTSNTTPFLAYSGPEEVFEGIKCYQCPPHGSIEEVVPIPNDKAERILGITEEVLQP